MLLTNLLYVSMYHKLWMDKCLDLHVRELCHPFPQLIHMFFWHFPLMPSARLALFPLASWSDLCQHNGISMDETQNAAGCGIFKRETYLGAGAPHWFSIRPSEDTCGEEVGGGKTWSLWTFQMAVTRAVGTSLCRAWQESIFPSTVD